MKVSAHPISIDAFDFSQTVQKDAVKKMSQEIHDVFANQRIILSVDRLDYSKGILERLEAFRLLLKDFPQYREKLILLMLVVPSRSDVPSYEEHKRKVDELVGNINSEYASLGWRPVHYYYQQVNRDTLCAYYAAADVCLVTSLRDGLNLVSKEYVACRQNNNGVLI
ncbi:MAG: trehalose-6-phosphate synthase, partial [Myroides sp.]